VYVNRSAGLVAVVPPSVVTLTCIRLGRSDPGATAVIDESSFTVKPAGFSPKVTPVVSVSWCP